MQPATTQHQRANQDTEGPSKVDESSRVDDENLNNFDDHESGDYSADEFGSSPSDRYGTGGKYGGLFNGGEADDWNAGVDSYSSYDSYESAGDDDTASLPLRKLPPEAIAAASWKICQIQEGR